LDICGPAFRLISNCGVRAGFCHRPLGVKDELQPPGGTIGGFVRDGLRDGLLLFDFQGVLADRKKVDVALTGDVSPECD
jgi:hypothetical protein